MMTRWGGRTLSDGQSVVLLVDDKDKQQAHVEEVKAQLPSSSTTLISKASDLAGHSAFDAVISFISSTNLLTNALSALKPGGFIVLYTKDAAHVEELEDSLLLSGFIETKTSKFGEFQEISSVKPNYEVGASQKLNLTRLKPAGANGTGNGNGHSVSAQDARNIWSSTKPDEQDLIDENELLDDDDRASKPKPDDCEVGKGGQKKACKNCTCGRAEEEQNGNEANKPRLTKEMLENPGVGSSCGSCSLGDAFRCAGCPYRGLPSFKVGEKITLPAGFNVDDIDS